MKKTLAANILLSSGNVHPSSEMSQQNAFLFTKDSLALSLGKRPIFSNPLDRFGSDCYLWESIRCSPLPADLVTFLHHLGFKDVFLGFFILLTHEGSHREVYRDFQPNLTLSVSGAKGLFIPQVPCLSSLHCPVNAEPTTSSGQI